MQSTMRGIEGSMTVLQIQAKEVDKKVEGAARAAAEMLPTANVPIPRGPRAVRYRRYCVGLISSHLGLGKEALINDCL